MVENTSRKLVTIITEALLEKDLLHDLERLGVRGYTVTDARGRGTRGVRDAGWEHGANIRVELVCDSEIAAAVGAHLRDRYYRDYAMILFMHDVEIMRPDKF